MNPRAKLPFTAPLLILSLLAAMPTQARDRLLITGHVATREAQAFVVPRSDTWQQQIKWIADEGKVVQPGDLVLVFDSSNVLSEIKQKETELETAEQKAREETLKLQEQLLDARHKARQAALQVERAKIDAAVPVEQVSKFAHEEARIALARAERNAEQTQNTLANLEKTALADGRKNQLEVQRIRNELLRKQADLKNMELRADRSGPVLRAMHPWNGSKITPGANVQPGWLIAEVPNTAALEVHAWINEVDRPHLREDASVELALDAAPRQTFKGRITRIGHQAEQRQQWGEAGYVEVRISPDSAAPLPLTPGMSVRIDVRTANASGNTAGAQG